MPRGAPVDPAQAARDTISAEIPRMVEMFAQIFGPGLDAEPVSRAKQIQDWGTRDPKIADLDGMKQHLMQQGLPQDLLDPKSPSALAIVQAVPEIAPMYAQPCDDKLADMLVRLAEWPLRLGILAPYEDDPEQMVKVAESLDAAWQKESGVHEPLALAAPESVSATAPQPAGMPVPTAASAPPQLMPPAVPGQGQPPMSSPVAPAPPSPVTPSMVGG